MIGLRKREKESQIINLGLLQFIGVTLVRQI